MSEVWPRLTAATFYEGDILKDYDHNIQEIFIISTGEASVYARCKASQDVMLNTYGRKELLCDT